MMGESIATYMGPTTSIPRSGPWVAMTAAAARGAVPGSSALRGVNAPSVTLVVSSGRSKPVENPVSDLRTPPG